LPAKLSAVFRADSDVICQLIRYPAADESPEEDPRVRG
jgi:hypothetical protein